MRAIQVTALDGPRSVQVADVAEPEAGDGQVLIEVHAAGVDVPRRAADPGQVPAQARPAVHAGRRGRRHRAGRAAGRAGVGGRSRVRADDVRRLRRTRARARAHGVPDPGRGVGFAAAASLPINYLTVHFALTKRAPARCRATPCSCTARPAAWAPRRSSSPAARGATVIAVASTDAKAELARAAGAQHAVAADGFRDAVGSSPTGAAWTSSSTRSVATGSPTRCAASRSDGRLLVIGFVGGEIPTVKVNRLLLNNTSVVGVAWGAVRAAAARTTCSSSGASWNRCSLGCAGPPIGHEIDSRTPPRRSR